MCLRKAIIWCREQHEKKKQRKERKHPSNLTTVDCHEEAEEAEKEKSRAEARKKNATSCFCDSHDNTNKENNKEVLNWRNSSKSISNLKKAQFIYRTLSPSATSS